MTAPTLRPPTSSNKSAAPQHWRGVLPVHPAAELFPQMSESELRELGDDIKRHCLHNPIVIFTDRDGAERLLDGRNRLDAMELVGLPIVKDGKLEPGLVPTCILHHNEDPFAWVLSANIHRRHLTSEQKRDVVAKLLKAKPAQSNLAIAKQVKVDDKTVAKVRAELEARSEIPNVKTRTDSKGREQPAKKQDTRAPSITKTNTCEVTDAKAEPSPYGFLLRDDTSLATELHERLNDVWALCICKENWPALNQHREKRRANALKQFRLAWSELVELAKPAATNQGKTETKPQIGVR